MATTSDYLTQLQADKQTLVNNLVEKGVEANANETFTSLAPKVLDIKSGGGELERGVIINACDENGYITDVTVKGILNMPLYFMRYAFSNSRNKWAGENLILRIKDITPVANQAFRYNDMVKKLIVTNCTLGNQYIFQNCTSLEEAIFETNISYMAGGVFHTCTALKKLSFPNNTEVCTINSDTFTSCPLETIEVPSALVDSWKVAENWSNYADKIVGI